MKIYFVYACDEDGSGEVEGMFSEDGTLLGSWACNDGQWRSEYFNHFMNKLGINVEASDDELLAEKLLKEYQ
jgi:hypothetical protein